MFTQTRLKLTGWYLLIIMFISFSFSAAIYKVLTSEFDRIERIQRLRQERQEGGEFRQRLSRPFIFDPELITETKNRLKMILLLINAGIFGLSSLAGYFLAGRTLKPIKEMMDEQERFITDTSHELRTPLTSLKSEIEVNLRDKNLNLSDAKKLLQSNLEEVNNLQYLSDGLIKLTGNQKANGLSLESVSLKVVVVESIRKVISLAKYKSITIKNDVADLILEGNKQALIELLVILLDNAIKYTPKKGLVTISSRKIDGEVEIEVKDNGMGIAKQDLPHLFDRFYRADKSRTKSEAGGYGLGLSIAKQIVEKHNGIIKVNSIVAKGTTFIIQLPL